MNITNINNMNMINAMIASKWFVFDYDYHYIDQYEIEQDSKWRSTISIPINFRL